MCRKKTAAKSLILKYEDFDKCECDRTKFAGLPSKTPKFGIFAKSESVLILGTGRENEQR
jgi:hypothetical protein